MTYRYETDPGVSGFLDYNEKIVENHLLIG